MSGSSFIKWTRQERGNLVETAVEKSGVQEIRHTIILTKVLMDVVGTLQESNP